MSLGLSLGMSLGQLDSLGMTVGINIGSVKWQPYGCLSSGLSLGLSLGLSIVGNDLWVNWTVWVCQIGMSLGLTYGCLSLGLSSGYVGQLDRLGMNIGYVKWECIWVCLWVCLLGLSICTGMIG